MANGKNCRPAFNLLRNVIQGKPSVKWHGQVRSNREIGTRVLGTWRNAPRHPSSVSVPTGFFRFHSGSYTLQMSFFQTKLVWKNLVRSAEKLESNQRNSAICIYFKEKCLSLRSSSVSSRRYWEWDILSQSHHSRYSCYGYNLPF